MGSRELLTRYYALLADQKFAAAVDLFRNEGEIIWSIPGTGPLAGKYETKAAIEAALNIFDGGSLGTVERPMHAICLADDGEHVAAQYLLRLRDGDATRDIVAIDAWHVDGDSLAEVWTFFENPADFDQWTRDRASLL
jgi:ketosteroid isomerase-like protein